MFESILASILNRYLSEYIDEVDYNNLKVGIFSGTLELRNVKVKPSALYQFDLPVEVKCGMIGKLKINISWTNIMTKPAVAEIEDLFVLLGPFEDKVHDPKRIEEMLMAHKRKQLQEIDKIDKTEILENKEKGFAEKVQDTIINNIQIYIKNVHIRYEDKYSIKNKNISFGLYLKEFRAETVDADGKPNFLNAMEKIVYKLGVLKGFNFYWNSSDNLDSFITTQPEFKQKKDNWITYLRDSIETRRILNTKFENFIENNLDLETRLTLRRSNQKSDFNLPKITFQSSVNAIDFVFQRFQYKTILQIVDYYSLLNVHKLYVKYRPKQTEIKGENVKLWWKYAFTALAETTWRLYKKERMLEHWRNYKKYLTKYEEKLVANMNNKPLSEKSVTELDLLEKSLILESIFDLRAECKGIIRKRYNLRDEEAEKKKSQEDYHNNLPVNYVEFRFILNFPFISLNLTNTGFKILKLDLIDIVSHFELRPIKNNVYFLINTRGVNLYGVHYKDNLRSGNNKMVPIVKSRNEQKKGIKKPTTDAPVTLLASEHAKDVLFTFCFETNPLKIENVEYSIRTRVSSLEVFYEKTAITELLKFFKTELIDFEEVKKIREAWSRAGLIYAVENHKQFHVKAELSSPYFIIPVKGTCMEEGSSIVFFLGETLIQSEVQPKRSNYTPIDIKDLEANFYDKFILDVKNIQVILVPKNVSWYEYLNNSCTLDYIYHILYPVSTSNKLYLSINPSYKKLPKLKIDALCESIRLNFSDNKIIKIADFVQNFPLPEMPKSTPSSTAIPVPVYKKTAEPNPKKQPVALNDPGSDAEALKKSFKILDSENSKNLIEPDDEWDGPFNLPVHINGDPIPNYNQIAFMFTIDNFMIDLRNSNDLILDTATEKDYLEFIFNSIKIDFAITKFGVSFRAGLGDLKLTDKMHKSKHSQYTEILSSSSLANLNQIIKFYFRQVEKEAPNFKTLYNKILTNILFDCSNIHVSCHREVIIDFIKFAKGITDNITLGGTKQVLEIVDEKKQATTQIVVTKKINQLQDYCDFNLIARMNELTWKMYDTNMSFGDMRINELSLTYNLSGMKTDLGAKLKAIIINYDNDSNKMVDTGDLRVNLLNQNYKEIISCTGDGNSKDFFDFKLVLYDFSNVDGDKTALKHKFSDSVTLHVGKIKVNCLVKFVNELLNFIDPIVNPLPSLTEQVKEQAMEAVNMVKNVYQENQSEGKEINLDIHVQSPQVIIPQNSLSFSAFLVDLGTLSIKNRFVHESSSTIHEDEELKTSTIDEITLLLNNVEVKRISYHKNEFNMFEIKEQVIEPINLNATIKRIINGSPSQTKAELDILVNLNDPKMIVSLKSAKLLFAILDENLNEGLSKPSHDVAAEISSKIDASSQIIDLDKGNKAKKAVKKENESSNKIQIASNDNLFIKLKVEMKKMKLIIVELKANQSMGSKFKDLNMPSSPSVLNQVNFSSLEVQEVFLIYDRYQNNSWNANFKMKALKLKDLRPDSNLAIKDMFTPKNKEKFFIELLYSVDKDMNASLGFNIDHLRVNLCLPFILKLYGMAMEAISPPEKANKKVEIKDIPQNIEDFKNRKKSVKPPPPASVQINQDQNQNNTSLKVIGKINLPEIVLFAQPEKSNSKLLIMNCDINLSFISKNNQTQLAIELIELALRLGEFNNYKKGIPFLSPCTAKITMEQTNSQIPTHYKASIPSLYFNMTQTLYEVVMGVMATINQSGTEKKQKETEIKRLLEDSEPFVKHKIDKDMYLKNNKSIEEEDAINAEKLSKGGETEENQKDQEDKKSVKLLQVLETLDLSINEAFVTFCEETGIDLQPLAILRFELYGKCSNWTRNLHIKAKLSFEASYYNDRLSNWEPLIENSLIKEDLYRPWIISLWFALEPGGVLQPPIDNKGIETIDFPVQDLDYAGTNIDTSTEQSDHKIANKNFDFIKASYVLIESNDMLSINITPCAYKVIMYLAQLTSGSNKEFVESSGKPQLKFLNFLGEKCTLVMSTESNLIAENAIDFELIKHDSPQTKISAEPLDLALAKNKLKSSQRPQIDSVYNETYKFTFQMERFEKCKLSMKNDGCYLFQLREDLNESESQIRKNFEAIKYNVMFKVKTLYGRTKVIFSSPLQIENNCEIKLLILVELTENVRKEKLNILYETEMQDPNSKNMRSFGVLFKVLPSKLFHVPLYAAYNCKIYAKPENPLYFPALIFDIRGYNLRLGDTNEVNCIRMDNINVNKDEFKEDEYTMLNKNDFQLVRQLILNVKSHKNVMPSMHANYRVALYQSLKISNCLPISIRLDIDDDKPFSTSLEAGENLSVHLCRSKLKFCKVHILNYLNTSWVGEVNWNKFLEEGAETDRIEMSVAPTTEMQVSGKHLSIYISFIKPNEFTFYCPYWLVNKSGQQIKIRSCDNLRTFEIPDEQILMFDFKKVDKNNKVTMNVKNGKWSKPFSLEAAGTTGMIQCKDDFRTYNFLMRITMSNSSRAKLITFAPFLSIVNELEESFSIREWYRHEKTSNRTWQLIDPISQTNKPAAIWPNFAGESKQVCFAIRLKDDYETQPFPLENPGIFVLIAKNLSHINKNQNTNTNLSENKLNNDTNGIINFDLEASTQKLLTILISGGSQNPVTVVVRSYQYGDAPAKFVNLCPDLSITIREKRSIQSWILEPLNSMFFVWNDLIRSSRELEWTTGTSKYAHDVKLTKSSNDKYAFLVDKNSINTTKNSSDVDITANENNESKNLIKGRNKKAGVEQQNVDISCVSYIDGSQRVIVFTTDHSWAELERHKEASSMEIFLTLKGIQISVINSLNLEIAIISIKNSTPVWSLSTANETKIFSNEYCDWLEKNYSNYLLSADDKFSYNNNNNYLLKISKSRNSINKDNKFLVNFDDMTMSKPEKGNIKRIWHPGLSVQYRTSSSMMSLKCCIYKIQIDNQLPDAYFPISFYQTPKVVKESNHVFIPFMSLSLFTEQQEVIQIYRYFDCLLQEFYLKLDKGFVFSLKDWYDSAIESTKNEDRMFGKEEEIMKEPFNLLVLVDRDSDLLEKINLDIKLTKEIMEYVNQSGGLKQSAHIRFDDFYLSPIVFNLSFSVNGNAHTDDKPNDGGKTQFIVNFFMESIGATITEFKDVKFQFKLFNLNNKSKTWKELYDEIFDHYKIQVLNQAYVLLLGLDVLGNPFGLVSDFSQGLTDLFYDPLLGYFSKSNEVEKIELKMSNKIRSTINKTISSAAGSGSLITGSFGRVLATCTFDKEYKRKRQYKLSKTSTSSFTDTLTIAGKGMVSGLVNGLIGTVKIPIEESKNDGATGVFKGLGKGFLGLFVKPMGSLFDGISLSLDGIKRISQSGSEAIQTARLPRHLINEVAILPYSDYQAKGYEILRDLQNDDIALDENYWAHLFVENKNKKDLDYLLFVTDCNIYKLKKTRTQILKKWYLLEKPIALHKVTHTKIIGFKQNDLNSALNKNQKSIKSKKPLIANVSEEQLNHLYVSCSDATEYDFFTDANKILLLTSDKNTAQWFNDKINSAIKYYRELRSFIKT